MRDPGSSPSSHLVALLGPTNTGKTHRALDRLLRHRSGIIGLPLRLLAREVYERVTARVGESRVALLTGEEKRVPPHPDYWVCTTESMPQDLDVEFVCVDEIQMVAHRQRGHAFTDRLLHARGTQETWFLGAETVRPLVEQLVPTAEVDRMPRFSQLRYLGPLSLGGLPPRTAVVAFSMSEVYELAERLRQLHGGTAVVLGALSPRTRNAQVAMYEAGEVDYMVATDAIGMGLNLDLDRVVFASLQKFDGREARALDTSELGQIAGRAGRYTRDGGFGVLRPLGGLTPAQVTSIERHRFEPLNHAVWRNSDLDFSSIGSLIESLRVRPPRPGLKLIEQADDYDALLALSRRDTIVRACSRPQRVALLWDVCRIPDFRKLLVGSHMEFLEQIFVQLSGPQGRIDVDWMARRIEHLDDVEGSIDGLMHRMSFIRTWTYITHQEAWIEEPHVWQERTRAIEDRQSDALHTRLTDRFVDRVSKRRRRSPPQRPRRSDPRHPEPPVLRSSGHHPFERLADLALAHARDTPDPGEDAWIEGLVDAPHDAFTLSPRGEVCFEGRGIAQFRPSADIVRPDVVLCDLEALGAGSRQRILRRVTAWARDAARLLVEGLPPMRRRDLSSAGRGLAYQLEQGLGSVDIRQARAQLLALTPRDHELFRERGVEIGPAGAFLRSSVDAPARRLRAILWTVHHACELPVELPSSDTMMSPASNEIDRRTYNRLGYWVRAGLAIRVDALHTVVEEVFTRVGKGPAFIHGNFGAALGLRPEQLRALLRDAGLRSDGGGRWFRPAAASPRRRRRGRRSA